MRLQFVLLLLVASIHELRAFRVRSASTNEFRPTLHAEGSSKQLTSTLTHRSSEVLTTAGAGGDASSSHAAGNGKHLAEALMHRSSEVLTTADADEDASSALLEHGLSRKSKKDVCCGKFDRPDLHDTVMSIKSVKKKKGRCHRWWWEGVASALNYDSHNQNLDKAVRVGYTQFDGCCDGLRDGKAHGTSRCSGTAAIQIPEEVSRFVYDEVVDMYLDAASRWLNPFTYPSGSHLTPNLAIKNHIREANKEDRWSTEKKKKFRTNILPALLRIGQYLSHVADQEFSHADEEVALAATVETNPNKVALNNQTRVMVEQWAQTVTKERVGEIIAVAAGRDHHGEEKQFTDKEKAIALLTLWRAIMSMPPKEVDYWGTELSHWLARLHIP